MKQSKKKAVKQKDTGALFNAKEKAVIRMICRQYSNREMADKLNLSIRTIEGYRDMIFKKTRAKNSVGVVVYAIRNGIYKV